LSWRVWRFRSFSSSRVLLHYAAVLERHQSPAALPERCESELDDLAQQFGFPIRRVVVFLFPTNREFNSIYGRRVGGFALDGADAVVVADDENLGQAVRHELVHLFAARWNRQAPPLFQKGLAVWLQEAQHGKTAGAGLPAFCDLSLPLTAL
jgi:hypothetical protein